MNTNTKTNVKADRKPKVQQTQETNQQVPYVKSKPIPIPQKEGRFWGGLIRGSDFDDIGYVKTDFAFDDQSDD